MLVLGDNFLVMFVGWEGVGLCSYLLIGYYFKKSARTPAKKAFVMNRMGDWGVLIGIFLILLDVRHVRFRACRCSLRSDADGAAHFGVRRALPAAVYRCDWEIAQIPLFVGCRTRWKGRRRCPR